MGQKSFLAMLVAGSAITFAAVFHLSGPPAAIASPLPVAEPAAVTSVYYAGCREVRAAGKAPLHAGEPGYREGMDGDGDGIACEAAPGVDVQETGGWSGGRRSRRR